MKTAASPWIRSESASRGCRGASWWGSRRPASRWAPDTRRCLAWTEDILVDRSFLSKFMFSILPDMMNPLAPGLSFMADIRVADTCLIVIKLTFPSWIHQDINKWYLLVVYSAWNVLNVVYAKAWLTRVLRHCVHSFCHTNMHPSWQVPLSCDCLAVGYFTRPRSSYSYIYL